MSNTVMLKRVALVQYGLGQPPKLSTDGIPILRATNITRGKITEPGLLRARLEDLPLDRAPLLKEGEILVVRSGAYTGDSARITAKWAGSAPGYDLRVTPLAINSRYLAYALLGIAAQDQIKLVSSRAAQPHLNAEELGELQIWMPSSDEQRRIADFLDAETSRIDRLLALQTTVLERLDERESAIVDLAIDELIDRVGTTPFRRFIIAMDQGSSPQCDAVPASDDEWGVLKVSCLRPGSFFPDQNKRLPEDAVPDVRNEVREGDVLITRANTPQLVGSTAVVPAVRRKLLLSDKIFRVGLSPLLDAHYVAWIARGTRVRSFSSASSNGASQSMANIRFEEVKEWPIPHIDLPEQKRVVAELDRSRMQTDALRSRITRQLTLLAERRQALITAAVTGQFDVSTASGRGED
ncbi:restriction endonuclease subunit S [Streptomyces sp. HUAS MG91]|uniref:Restriction endonuclease subunit S n=1 Tax=Streptomyces tabacisoli TaxID=3156398 RepID=A0AAU8IPA5_9ACTN